MNTTLTDQLPSTSAAGRVFGVVTRPQTYRNLAYLLLGLPLGTIWFTVLVTGASVAASLIAVALIGIPMLYALWYAVRVFANAERALANTLLGQHLASAPIGSPVRGNPWVRLRALSREPIRRRELGYLLLRFPVGIATFTGAVTALTAPVAVAYAPISARYVDDSFGDWFWSTELHDFAADSPWAWSLVALGAILLIGALHLLNVLADVCGRWTTARLDRDS
jgi:uncharacterized membrane protein YuzA (DUF378 family)